MTDPVVAIVNAPLRFRQALAVGLLLAGVCASVLLVWWTVASLAALRSQVVEKRETIGRLQAIVALKEALQHEGDAALPGAGQNFLEGQTEAVVRGNIQTKLGNLIGTQGASLISISNASDMDIGNVRYLGVRADLSGTVEAVRNAILSIETTTPMIVRTASIWLSSSAGGGVEAPQLTAQISVYGPLPSGDVKQAGPAP